MIRVIKLGDVIKNLVKVVILIIGIVLVTRFFSSVRKFNLQTFINNKKQELQDKTVIECLDDNLDIKYSEKNEQNLISKELAFIKSVLVPNDVQNYSDIALNEGENVQAEKEQCEVPKFMETHVIEEHNKKDVYNTVYSSVLIKNETSVQLTEDMLVPDIMFDKSNIVIFHTHTSESYTPTEEYSYEACGNFRTVDNRCNVVGVGNELQNKLMDKGMNVIHDTTFHDYPEYNGSYTRSMQTVQNVLSNVSADLVIDLHRDALADSAYGPSVMIGDERAAQIMFVIGSNEGGLEHSEWLSNLKVAVKIQEKANEMYPGLFKPILVSKYRYNQHLAKGACIIEVGATGNTMEECLVSMKYLAEIIESVV